MIQSLFYFIIFSITNATPSEMNFYAMLNPPTKQPWHPSLEINNFNKRNQILQKKCVKVKMVLIDAQRQWLPRQQHIHVILLFIVIYALLLCVLHQKMTEIYHCILVYAVVSSVPRFSVCDPGEIGQLVMLCGDQTGVYIQSGLCATVLSYTTSPGGNSTFCFEIGITHAVC